MFIEEQGVDEHLELDGLEDACIHFLVWHEEGEPLHRAVGTARLWTDDQGRAKAQRVAVLADARGSGAGRRLMRRLEATARERGHTRLDLGVQLEAIAFYEALGYRAYGDEFDDAGIPHRMMERELSD
ncbi:MAG: GNAT family N-acetyltransferase [Myxococcota bacterium]|nr:GNAT family N-acetyltransferase [Myxococcota bacterium]